MNKVIRFLPEVAMLAGAFLVIAKVDVFLGTWLLGVGIMLFLFQGPPKK